MSPYDPTEWSHGKRIANKQGDTVSNQEDKASGEIRENEPAPAEPAPSYTFQAGEIIVAEGDAAYSFVDASNFAEIAGSMTDLRRAVVVARLRAVAEFLERA